jgi:Na+/citrate or Na+/malate symporter
LIAGKAEMATSMVIQIKTRAIALAKILAAHLKTLSKKRSLTGRGLITLDKSLREVTFLNLL